MKTLEFETSKGKFKIIDMPDEIRVNGWNGSIVIDKENQISREKYEKGFYLINATEEQANAIVDKVMNNQHFQNYDFKEITDRWTKSAIESLHSLLKSKGIHLFRNPNNSDYFTNRSTEEKTFYNPFIFKL